MGRPTALAALFGPAREWWQICRREDREAAKALRVRRKATDKARPKCRCKAYPWPHRPAGGYCRFPDQPTECWQRKPKPRRYRDRYAGLRRQIARANGLHPIRDREAIQGLLPGVLHMAKQAKGNCPRMLYRNIEITKTGAMVHLRGSEPDWHREG